MAEVLERTTSSDIVADARDYFSLLRLLQPVYTRWQDDPTSCVNDVRRYVTTWLSAVRNDSVTVELFSAWHAHCLVVDPPESHLVEKDVILDIKSVVLHGFAADDHKAHISDPRTVSQKNVTFLTNSIREVLPLLLSFISKVQLPHFLDRVFLEKAARRLDQFAHLQKQHQEVRLVPTLDILLIVLTDNFCGRKKTKRNRNVQSVREIAGIDVCQLLSAASTNDVTPTTSLWLQEVRTPYLVPGCQWLQSDDLPMGHIPFDRLKPEEGAVFDITLNNLRIGPLWTHEKSITVEGRRLGESSFSYQTLFRVKGRIDEPMSIKATYDCGKVLFDVTKHRGIEFHIYGRKGKCCRYNEDHVSMILFDPRKAFDDHDMDRHVQQIELPRVYKSDPKVTFDCEWQVRRSSPPSIFSLLRNPFSVAPIPADLLNFVETLTSWDGADIRNPEMFITAQHSVHLRRSDTNLIVQVICHTRAPLAGLLLYDQKEGLLAATHVISDDILPHSAQVSSDCRLTLDPESEATAMLIHNRNGPWALVKMSCDPVIDRGNHRVTLFNIKDQKLKEMTLDFKELTSFVMGDVTCELQTGRLTVSSGCQEITETLTTAFCVGIMYVLLYEMKNVRARSIESPRTIPRQVRSKMERNEASKYHKGSLTLSKLKKQHRRKRSMVCTMMLACGLEQTIRPTSIYADSTLGRASFYSSTLSLGLLHPSDDKDLTIFTASNPRLNGSWRLDTSDLPLGDSAIGYSSTKGITNPIYDPMDESPRHSSGTPSGMSLNGDNSDHHNSHDGNYVVRYTKDSGLMSKRSYGVDYLYNEEISLDSGRGTADGGAIRDPNCDPHRDDPHRDPRLNVNDINTQQDMDDFINSIFEPSLKTDFTQLSPAELHHRSSDASDTIKSRFPEDLRPDSAFGSEIEDHNDKEVVFIEHM